MLPRSDEQPKNPDDDGRRQTAPGGRPQSDLASGRSRLAKRLAAPSHFCGVDGAGVGSGAGLAWCSLLRMA